MKLPATNHLDLAARRRVMVACLRAPARHTIMLIDCDCRSDLECFRKIWYPCDQPEREPDRHSIGGECPRCMTLVCERILARG